MNEELNCYLLSLVSTGSKLNGDSKFSLKSEVVETEMLIISLSIEGKFWLKSWKLNYKTDLTHYSSVFVWLIIFTIYKSTICHNWVSSSTRRKSAESRLIRPSRYPSSTGAGWHLITRSWTQIYVHQSRYRWNFIIDIFTFVHVFLVENSKWSSLRQLILT